MSLGLRNPAYELRRLSQLGAAFARERRLRKHDRWRREQIVELQDAQRRLVVEYATGHSRFYRELYASIDSPHTAPLADLPTVDKGQLMERFDDWVTDRRLRRDALQEHLAGFDRPDGFYQRGYRAVTTGGSSGRKATFVFSGAEWSVLQAQLLRFINLIGVSPLRIGGRLRSASVAAGHALHVTARAAASMDVGLAKVLRLDATSPLSELVDELNRFQPEWLHAYPSVAAMLADEQLQGRLSIAPGVVSTSSELRTPEMTERIARAWGRRPHDMYGITEAGIFAMECEQYRLHAMDDQFIFEVVDADGRPAPSGEAGEKLLITNLFMRTQPLIRYEVDDLVAVSAEPCPCGRPFPVLESVEGRSDDVITLPARGGNHVRVHPMHFRSPLAAEADVRQYQVLARDDEILLRLVPSESADREALERRVLSAVRGRLTDAGAEAPPLRVEFVQAIERDPERMSKLKLVSSERTR